MEYLANGTQPDFLYDKRPTSTNIAGVLFPEDPMPVAAGFAQLSSSGALEPRFLTPVAVEQNIVAWTHALFLRSICALFDCSTVL
jgi:hypothetical protein